MFAKFSICLFSLTESMERWVHSRREFLNPCLKSSFDWTDEAYAFASEIRLIWYGSAIHLQPLAITSISLVNGSDNPAKSLVVQTITDKEGKESQQVINLMGYCTTLAITIQELIKENKELKNEIIEIKNRLNNIEK